MSRVLLYSIFFGLTIFTGCNKLNAKREKSTNVRDSIDRWIAKSDDDSYQPEQKKLFLKKAYKKVLLKKSLQLKYLSVLAYKNLALKDTTLFKNQSSTALQIALKEKDSFVIGDVYWGYASYYIDLPKYDSAYYYFDKAERYFKNNPYYKGTVLIGKSWIENRYKSYSKSKSSSIRAAKIFRSIKEYKKLSVTYNNLGGTLDELGKLDEALSYYYKALNYAEKGKHQKGENLAIYNNIGIAYKKKKDYTTALNYFEKELLNNNFLDDKEMYARIISNIAHTKLLKQDTSGVYISLKRGLKIRDSIQSKEGLLSSYFYLSDYFLYANDTLRSIYYLNKTKKLSYSIKNNKYYSKSLQNLAKVDSLNKVLHLENYITHRDSVLKQERNFHEKFARISYETEKYITESKQLKKSNYQLLIFVLVVLIVTLLLYFLIRAKNINEKLLLETEQQKLNENLYLLALKSQQKIKSVQVEERNRIAEELHDNVLSKLFGIRLKLDFFPSFKDEELQAKYKSYISEIQSIEKEIRDVSHQLNTVAIPYAIDFEDVFSSLLVEKQEQGNFKLNYTKDENFYLNDLSDLIKVHLYRVLQEALHNVVKHAEAENVWVSFTLKNKELCILIQDDGIGFEIKKVNKGLGIKNMQSRIAKLKGTISFTSEKKNTIKIVIPIKHKD